MREIVEALLILAVVGFLAIVGAVLLIGKAIEHWLG
jgi:hypothetical protein